MQPDQPLLQPSERPQDVRQSANRDQRQAHARVAVDRLLDLAGRNATADPADLETALGLAACDLIVTPDLEPEQEFPAACVVVAAAVRRLAEMMTAVDAAYERGLAEGRRQATEGWDLPLYVVDDSVSCNDHDCPCTAGYVLPLSRRTTARELAEAAAKHRAHFQRPAEPASGGVVEPSPLTAEDANRG